MYICPSVFYVTFATYVLMLNTQDYDERHEWDLLTYLC